MEVSDLLARLERVAPAGPGKWRASCPSHEDRHPSLSISLTSDSTILVKCHAGCDAKSIVESVGLSLKDLFPSTNGHRRPESKPTSKPATYFTNAEAARDEWVRILGSKGYTLEDVSTFHDKNGNPVIEELRFFHPKHGKTIRPTSRCDQGWQLKLPPAPRPIFALPAIFAETGTTVFVPEGPRKAKLLNRLGLLATSSGNGAKGFRQSDWKPLAGRDVVILPDNDGPGKEFAEGVAEFLLDLHPPAQVKIVELPLAEGEDVVEFVERMTRDSKDEQAIKMELERLARLAQVKTAATAPAKEQDRKDHGPIHLTDLGNGQRLAQAHGEILRHCHPWAKWLHWDSTRWRIDDAGAIKLKSKGVILSLFDDARNRIDKLQAQIVQEEVPA